MSSSDQVRKILEQCFPNADTFRITENPTNGKHHNVISNVINLTIEYQEDGVENKKFLVLKIPKSSDATSYFDELAFYSREAFMYDVVIPRINSYLDTPITPVCFKTIDSRIIILENLTFLDYEKGGNYRLHLKQCLPIVKALAHFHASSHKVCQMDPHLLDKEILQYSAVLEWRQRIATFWEPILVELLARNNKSYLIPKFKNICLYLKREDTDVKSRIHYSNFKFLVLNHGDFHSDNVLLKYGSNDSVEVKIIDFQASFWSTPICDFMNFFFLGAEADLIENHFETLLDWYLHCLNEKLKTNDCFKEYRKQDFLEDIQTLNFCSVLYAMCLSFILYPLDRVPLADVIFHKQTENIQYYIDVCLNDKIFSSHVLNCLKLCERLGLLEPTQSNSPLSDSQ